LQISGRNPPSANRGALFLSITQRFEDLPTSGTDQTHAAGCWHYEAGGYKLPGHQGSSLNTAKSSFHCNSFSYSAVRGGIGKAGDSPDEQPATALTNPSEVSLPTQGQGIIFATAIDS